MFYLVPRQQVDGRDSSGLARDRVEVDAVRPLFEMRAPDGLPRNFYDVASNGQRFMIVVPDDTASNPLTLVSNWPTLVKTAR